MSVITSSCVGPKQNSRSWRSVILSICGPNTAQRPVSSHSSLGCTAGISSSSAPALFISSRTIASTLGNTRKPSGIQLYSPEPKRLIRPARTISIWLCSSASLGASFWVLKKNCEARMIGSNLYKKQRPNFTYNQGFSQQYLLQWLDDTIIDAQSVCL